MNKITIRPLGSFKNREEHIAFLKKFPLFNEFTEDAIINIIENSTIKKYTKHDVLFMTGDRAKSFYIIINGWIKLSRNTRSGNESVISVLTAGEMFGKTAILNKGNHTYSAEAVTDSSMIDIPAPFMLHMAEDQKYFYHFLVKFIENELGLESQLSMDIEHICKMTSSQRVGCFLLRKCVGQKEGSISLQLTYEKGLIAGLLGMTSETFSRSLNQLTAYGVETDITVVKIHNMSQLRRNVCERCSATTRECHLGTDLEED